MALMQDAIKGSFGDHVSVRSSSRVCTASFLYVSFSFFLKEDFLFYFKLAGVKGFFFFITQFNFVKESVKVSEKQLKPSASSPAVAFCSQLFSSRKTTFTSEA